MAIWEINSEFKEAAALTPPIARIAHAPEIHKSLPSKPIAHRTLPPTKVPLPLTPPGAATAIAKIRVEILHHFAAGKATITIDGHEALEQELRSDDQRHPVFRALEMNQTANLEMSPGKHTVQLRVVAAENNYDQTETEEVEAEVNSQRVLIVNCDKRNMQVTVR
jgi:hypothetical protein